MRDGEHLRHAMQDRFREVLAAQPAPWVEVRGTAARSGWPAAVALVEPLLATPRALADPLEQRNGDVVAPRGVSVLRDSRRVTDTRARPVPEPGVRGTHARRRAHRAGATGSTSTSTSSSRTRTASVAAAGPAPLDEKLRQAYFWMVNHAIISPHYDVEFQRPEPAAHTLPARRLARPRSTCRRTSRTRRSSCCRCSRSRSRGRCLLVGGPGRGKTASAILMGVLAGYPVREVRRADAARPPAAHGAGHVRHAAAARPRRRREPGRHRASPGASWLGLRGQDRRRVQPHPHPHAVGPAHGPGRRVRRGVRPGLRDRRGGLVPHRQRRRGRRHVPGDRRAARPHRRRRARRCRSTRRFVGDLVDAGRARRAARGERARRRSSSTRTSTSACTARSRAVPIPVDVRRRLEYFAVPARAARARGPAARVPHQGHRAARRRRTRTCWPPLDTGRDQRADIGAQTLNGLSVRALQSLVAYAKAMAYFRGNAEVDARRPARGAAVRAARQAAARPAVARVRRPRARVAAHRPGVVDPRPVRHRVPAVRRRGARRRRPGRRHPRRARRGSRRAGRRPRSDAGWRGSRACSRAGRTPPSCTAACSRTRSPSSTRTSGTPRTSRGCGGAGRERRRRAAAPASGAGCSRTGRPSTRCCAGALARGADRDVVRSAVVELGGRVGRRRRARPGPRPGAGRTRDGPRRARAVGGRATRNVPRCWRCCRGSPAWWAPSRRRRSTPCAVPRAPWRGPATSRGSARCSRPSRAPSTRARSVRPSSSPRGGRAPPATGRPRCARRQPCRPRSRRRRSGCPRAPTSSAALERHARDPWWWPGVAAAPGVLRRIGGFRGFGGPWLGAPRVVPGGPTGCSVAADGARWAIVADVHGAAVTRLADEPDGARAGARRRALGRCRGTTT